MFKDKIKSIKALIDKEGEENNKKRIENLVVFIIILILTIIAINMIWKDEPDKSISNNNYTQLATTDNVEDVSSNIKVISEYNLEQNLEDILGKINGAGKVKVLITYSESSQIVPIINEKVKETITDEGDKVGGTRKIQESDKTTEVIYQENSGKKEIITR